jgi:hypothetical protein
MPEKGEIVQARRSTSDQYRYAVVIRVSERSKGMWKINVVWLQADDTLDPPIVVGTVGYIRTRTRMWPPLIRKWEPDPPLEQVRP